MKLFRLVLILSVALNMVGCASYEILSDQMQPDFSYRIIAWGNRHTDEDKIKSRAFNRANGLCPGGFKIKSQIWLEKDIESRFQLIAKCFEPETEK